MTLSDTNASQLATKWSKVAHVEHMRIATEPGNRFAGAKGLEMSLPISSREVSAALQKNVDTDTLFVRVYQKWASNYQVTGSNHNGIHISGGTLPGPGTPAPANGRGFFIFLLQNILSARPGEGLLPLALIKSMPIGRVSGATLATTGFRTGGWFPRAGKETGCFTQRGMTISGRCRTICHSATGGTATN